MDTFLDFALDGDDEKIRLLIICSCAYAVLMWMTGQLDIPNTYLDELGIPREECTFIEF